MAPVLNIGTIRTVKLEMIIHSRYSGLWSFTLQKIDPIVRENRYMVFLRNKNISNFELKKIPIYKQDTKLD